MFASAIREFYWPSMAMDCYSTVRSCTACAKERIRLRNHKSYLQTFEAKSPLEFVAINILEPIKNMKQGNEYLLVISDRFNKLTIVIQLKHITAYAVSRVFGEI